jgi:PAS domain-containing protein
LDDVFGWDWSKVIHPEDVQGLVGKWRSSLATGEPCEAEARVRRADGEYRWYLHREVPLRDQAGKIIRWFGSSIDIEDLKRADDALRKSEQRFQIVLDTIPSLIWSALPDGSVDYLNQRWQEYTGMPLTDAGGWGWRVDGGFVVLRWAWDF